MPVCLLMSRCHPRCLKRTLRLQRKWPKPEGTAPPAISGPYSSRGVTRSCRCSARNAADRIHHRTGTGAAHPAPSRRTRHAPAISPARPPDHGILRLGSIRRPRSGTGRSGARVRLRSNGQLVAQTHHSDQRLPTRYFDAGEFTCADRPSISLSMCFSPSQLPGRRQNSPTPASSLTRQVHRQGPVTGAPFGLNGHSTHWISYPSASNIETVS